MSSSRKKSSLGQGLAELGLSALLGDRPPFLSQSPQTFSRDLDIDVIEPGHYQPRQGMEKEALQELAASIRAEGVIQPIVVKQPERDEKYKIIAGERRWRAAKLVGKTEIPALIRNLSDHQAVSVAIIENLQREDLNPIETAEALNRLGHEFSMTHEAIAQCIGKSRASVSNFLRLLTLQPAVKALITQKQISMGHAKLLLGLSGPKQVAAADYIIKKALSVRATEYWLSHLNKSKPLTQSQSPKVPLESEWSKQCNLLAQKLGMPVTVKAQKKGGGQLTIRYKDEVKLKDLLTILLRS